MEFLKRLFKKKPKMEIYKYTPTSMERIQDLYVQLQSNCMELEKIDQAIEQAEEANADAETLEQLYSNEFFLYMNHVGIHEDLTKAMEEEPKTVENEMELARIRKAMNTMLQVEVVEI